MTKATAIALLSEMELLPGGPHTRYEPPLAIVKIPPFTP